MAEQPKLTGEFRYGIFALIEGAKGLLFLGAILLGGYGLSVGTTPVVRAGSGLILLCGALGGFFWPLEFKCYVRWFEIEGENFRWRVLGSRKRFKVPLATLRARSRSSRGERYACTIVVGEYEEVVVVFQYLMRGRELWERLQALMAERTPDE